MDVVNHVDLGNGEVMGRGSSGERGLGGLKYSLSWSQTGGGACPVQAVEREGLKQMSSEKAMWLSAFSARFSVCHGVLVLSLVQSL